MRERCDKIEFSVEKYDGTKTDQMAPVYTYRALQAFFEASKCSLKRDYCFSKPFRALVYTSRHAKHFYKCRLGGDGGRNVSSFEWVRNKCLFL